MRRGRLLVALALVAAACGGGDDSNDDAGAAAGEPAVVRSDDGRAELALPPGVDAGDITLEAVDREGAAAAYELLPAGTTFDEPAMLTVTGVDAPAGHHVAFAILESDDDDPVVVDGVETTYADEGNAATIAVPVAHFSTVTLSFFRAGKYNERLDVLTGDFGSPLEVAPQVPFEVPVRIEQLGSRLDIDIDWARDEVITVERTWATGSVTATNATPSEARRLPPFGELEGPYRGSGTFRCARPGRIDLDWVVQLTFELEYSLYQSFATTPFKRTATLRMERSVQCRAGATTTTESTTTTTTTAVSAAKPVVTEITSDLRVPVTTYTVTGASVTGAEIESYVWRMSGDDCGTPRTPWEQAGNPVSWSHADAPPDSCRHSTTDHEVTVSVTVVASNGTETTCTFTGSETRVITNPDCS